jgi:phosphatidylserine/phosphatidylglycerophosphate/cardiolipin synthase-like enzyme
MRISLFALTFSVLSSSVFADRSLFIPENGRYDISNDDVLKLMQDSGMDWVSSTPDRMVPSARYKLLKRPNEFRIKNWYRYDWYKLQDMFNLDEENFISHYKASTFNEAKKIQYAGFPFDTKRNYHRKTIPSMSEWGGLTHPPVKALTMPLEKYHSGYAPIDYSKSQSEFFSPELQAELDQITGSELTFGNKLDILEDRESFERKKHLIRTARESIFMSSLAFACDKSSRELVNLLIDRHRDGIDVRVITDNMISTLLGYKECPDLMRRAGIEVIMTNDFWKYNKKSIYHSKALVTDLKYSIAGGHNMLDADNLSRGVDFKNRDIDLYADGAMATDVAEHFIRNWNYHVTLQKRKLGLTLLDDAAKKIEETKVRERSEGKRGASLYSKKLATKNTRMAGVCRFISQDPYRDGQTVTKAYLKLIDHTKNYLAITDPVKSDTFVANKKQLPLFERMDTFEMFNLLHEKVQDFMKRGKKVDYLTTSMNMAGNENVAIMNEHIANDLEGRHPIKANWHFGVLTFSNNFYGKPHFKNLLKDYVPFPNTTVWTHISFLHSKIFYFDRIAASIGSVNFQHNATDHGYESTAICMDEELNRQLDRVMVQDMANSMPLVFAK